jgi:NAD(P)-dependent dehydrogenase (short-subunit alcohol dehydrogenase family)
MATKILSGKVAVITGAASGIGRATALRFAQEGARLALLDVNRDGLAAARQEVQSDALTIATDVSDVASVERACKEVVAKFGVVDIVVNAAGIELPGDIFDTSYETWDRTMAVNVTGSFLIAQAFLRVMKAQGHGSIVNVGSTASALGVANLLAYCVSKGAVAQLTRGMAVEAGPFGIRVNCVHPGFTNTPMGNAGAAQMGVPIEEFQAQAARKYPMARIAESYEVAAAILFLASDEASFITGAHLAVDGGLVAKHPLA